MSLLQTLARRRAHRHTGLVVAGVTTVMAVAVLAALLYAGTVLLRTAEHTEAVAQAQIAAVDSAFTAVDPLGSTERQRLRSYLNSAHVETAQSLGVGSLVSEEQAERLAEDGALVRLETNAWYVVEPMTYSVPYVTPDAARLLETIARRFQERLAERGLPPFRIVITSGTRSEENQAALRRVNGNAAALSSHQFGTTVDLHYRRFVYAPSHDPLEDEPYLSTEVLRERLTTAYANLSETYHDELEAILGRTLLELQRAGDVLVIHERRQPVFHITVGQRQQEA